MVNSCLIDARKKAKPSMISYKNRKTDATNVFFGSIMKNTPPPKPKSAENGLISAYFKRRSEISKNAAISPENLPLDLNSARGSSPTNTSSSQTSETDSSSSCDVITTPKPLSIPKPKKNLQPVPKTSRMKPNFKRRKSLLMSEKSLGKQRLLNEFFTSGLSSTNQDGVDGQQDL